MDLATESNHRGKSMFGEQIQCFLTVPDKDWFNHFFKVYTVEESVFFPALIPNYL